MSDIPDSAFGVVSRRAAILLGVNAVIANKFKTYPPMRTSPKGLCSSVARCARNAVCMGPCLIQRSSACCRRSAMRAPKRGDEGPAGRRPALSQRMAFWNSMHRTRSRRERPALLGVADLEPPRSLSVTSAEDLVPAGCAGRGMTGVLPPGGGAAICGSTPLGGQITPLTGRVVRSMSFRGCFRPASARCDQRWDGSFSCCNAELGEIARESVGLSAPLCSVRGDESSDSDNHHAW